MNIFVGGLARELTESDLRAAFEPFGDVNSVAIIKDKYTGDSRGFGFVEMPSSSQAQAAINRLNGTELAGRPLTVNEARPREERGNNPVQGSRDQHRARRRRHRGGRRRW